MSKRPQGVCKLTGSYGPYVKSHIVPKALTTLSGRPYWQGGVGEIVRRRQDSWYDGNLVGQSGEDILGRIDTEAIKILRKHGLVWSGWQGKSSPAYEALNEEGVGFRTLALGAHVTALRTFFLSVIWRAAASNLPDMRYFNLLQWEIDLLRHEILGNSLAPKWFFPATLIQLSTIGELHNYTPTIQVKTLPALGPIVEREIEFVRLYFDGLIVHLHRNSHDDGYAKRMGGLFLGNGEHVGVIAVPFEKSRQNEIIRAARSLSWNRGYSS